MATVADSLKSVRGRVDAAAQDRAKATGIAAESVRLVAVSKTKPVEALQEAYDAGQRHFGENYVQELVDKVPLLPSDIEWHFIGTLQSNKVAMLLKGCPNLACLETVTSEKLARAVDKAWGNPEQRLRVMVQVNSSGEESKNGVDPSECAEVCRIIVEECQALQLAGLMTIGAPDYSGCRTEDFETLFKCRDEVLAVTGIERLELSMGMSSDFENAIREGSSSVRVGSSIFGARSYPAKTS